MEGTDLKGWQGGGKVLGMGRGGWRGMVGWKRKELKGVQGGDRVWRKRRQGGMTGARTFGLTEVVGLSWVGG